MVLGPYSEVEQDMLEDAVEFCIFVVPQHRGSVRLEGYADSSAPEPRRLL
jgi:hypothetical protein